MYSIRGKRRRRDTNYSNPSSKKGRPSRQRVAPHLSARAFNAQLQLQRESVISQSPFHHEKLSALELLPNELIQQIFFYCFEADLPRSSPRLASALSHESIYRVLILFAFFDDAGDGPVETRLFLPATYRWLSIESKIRLQSGILRCRWCTLDRLRACLPDLCRLKMLQEWYREQQAELRLPGEYSGSTFTSFAQCYSPAELPDPSDADQMQMHFLQSNVFVQPELLKSAEHGYYSTFVQTWEPHISDAEPIVARKQWSRRLSVFAARVIPDWLLRTEDWTIDRLHLLQLLRRGSEYIYDDSIMQISAQSLMYGIASAIKAHHLDALATLLELNWACFAPKHWTRQYFQANSLPIALFHLAARQKAVSADLLYLLMRASADSIDHDDAILTAWAVRRKNEDDANLTADWLLKIMEGNSDVSILGNGRIVRSSQPGTWLVGSFAEESEYLVRGGGPITVLDVSSSG